jgi:hypothetical protein
MMNDDHAFNAVTAAMEACRTWFEREEITYTAADLLVMAKMVMRRERELGDAEKRAKFEARHRIGDQQDA